MAIFGIGLPLIRAEDARLLTEQGRYTADIDLDGQACGLALRIHNHAIMDALAEQGVTAIDMPATPQAVRRAIRDTA